MRPISFKRRLKELEHYSHVLTKGTLQHFHWENISLLEPSLNVFLALTGLRQQGEANARNFRVHSITMTHPRLPSEFDGYRVLFMSDLHVDGIPTLVDTLKKVIAPLEYDICILGGDYRFRFRGSPNSTIKYLNEISRFLVKQTPVYAILGNHDEYHLAEKMHHAGVQLLLNEHAMIAKGESQIYLVGVDDCHYYGAHDVNLAEKNIPPGAFKIMLSHSPELYKLMYKNEYAMYLAGHTHGGQICFPGGLVIMKNAKTPYRVAKGAWNYKGLVGYTSHGVGCSGVAVRFNCPPEVVLITFQKG